MGNYMRGLQGLPPENSDYDASYLRGVAERRAQQARQASRGSFQRGNFAGGGASSEINIDPFLDGISSIWEISGRTPSFAECLWSPFRVIASALALVPLSAVILAYAALPAFAAGVCGTLLGMVLLNFIGKWGVVGLIFVMFLIFLFVDAKDEFLRALKIWVGFALSVCATCILTILGTGFILLLLKRGMTTPITLQKIADGLNDGSGVGMVVLYLVVTILSSFVLCLAQENR